MIKKIAHLADIHIRRSTDRHQEYEEVFNRLYLELKKDKPDRIVIIGDLYHDYIEFQGEAMTLAGRFLNNLSEIAPLIITRGNHDIRKKNLNRQDFIKTIVELLNNKNIKYYEKTDIYEDENVSWCVWHHPDKNGPNIENAKGLKVDLFHDPIYSSISANGYRMDKEHYIKLDNFYGEYGFFGDIHRRQFFSKNKKAYCGSLIQQGYEESIGDHGYLLWDIQNGTVIERNLHNDYAYYTLNLGPTTDYDDLQSDQDFVKYPRIRVKWNANKADINKKNEIKIRTFLQQFTPIEIKIEKEPINVELVKTQTDVENIDDIVVQQQLFVEYLTQQNYKEDQIEKILLIDNEVNKYLDLGDKKGYDWSLQEIWMDNFKSYGEDVYWPISDLKGLLQITGENTQGKTTLLDAICYLLFGKTLSTVKKEKHGDARFINNKRDLDYCRVGGILCINSKIIKIVRRTDRSLNKKGQITQCTTTLQIFNAEDNVHYSQLTPDNELTGELLKDTQKMLHELFGDFEDFVRSVLTNADNLNQILSIDRAEFIDSVNRDAGLEIFEKKLAAYKEWKKVLDNRTERLKVDVPDTNLEIEKKNSDLIQRKKSLQQTEISIKKAEEQLSKKAEEKLKLAEKIIPIDAKLKNLSKDSIKNEISNIENKINLKKIESKKMLDSIKDLPQAFDVNSLNVAQSELSKINEKFQESLQTYQKLTTHLKDVVNDIESCDRNKNKILEDAAKKIQSEIDNINSEIKVLSESTNSDKKMATMLKENISELEKSKICVTCEREVGEEEKAKIATKIQAIQKKINDLKENYSLKNKSIEEASLKIVKLKLDLEELKTLSKIPQEVQFLLNLEEDQIKKFSLESEKIKKEIEKVTEEGKKCKIDVKIKQDSLDTIQKLQQQYVETLQTKQKSQEILLECESLSKDISEKLNIISSLEKIEEDILFNGEIEKQINIIIEEETTLKDQLSELKKESRLLENDILNLENDIVNLETLIKRYLEQLETDKLHSAYADCVHRDGVPTMLLKRMIGNINEELSYMLLGQPYSSYFDENLVLKLSHFSKLESSQNAIESSGKERTFISLALKMALRSINKRTKPNFVMLDEIMGKLINNSIEEFMELLKKITDKVEHVFIIEHNHPIIFDHQIDIIKDEYGVSDLKIIE